MTDNVDVWDAVKHPAPKAPYGFRVIKSNTVVKTVRLELDTTYIGRMPENHVVLDDPTVCRSHACVKKVGEDYVLYDQESENGLLYKGKKVKEVKLKLGDQVELGAYKLEVISATQDITTEKRVSRLDESQEEW